MSNNPAFGALLKQTRMDSGLSQAELAKSVDVDHSYICRIEAGTRNASRNTVDKLAKALDLDPEEEATFFASSGFLVPNASVTMEPTVAELDQLLQRPELPPIVRDRLLNEVKTIIAVGQASIQPYLAAT